MWKVYNSLQYTTPPVNSPVPASPITEHVTIKYNYQVFQWFWKMCPDFKDMRTAQTVDNEHAHLDLTDYNTVTFATINAIGVCYYVRISSRDEYLDAVSKYFK